MRTKGFLTNFEFQNTASLIQGDENKVPQALVLVFADVGCWEWKLVIELFFLLL
jgi:hypothetical protein